MRISTVAALGLAAILTVTAARPTGAADAAAEVREVLAAQQAAWNRGDLDGFMAAYWRSDSLTFYSGGDITRGWQTVRDRYQRRYQSGGQDMGRLAFELHSIVPVGKEAAYVRGAWSVERGGTTSRGLFTLVLRKLRGEGWRIVHDHTSVAAP
jgi:beta-aspartyl-peptidase (threonine type)